MKLKHLSFALMAIMFAACQSAEAVKSDYYNDVKSSASIEQKYIARGTSAVATATYPCEIQKYKQIEVWYPADLKTSGKTYPLVVMANGTGVPASRYQAVFEHLASWGFIVVGNEDPESWTGKSTSVTLDFMLQQNKTRGSIFFGKINTQHIGVAGHSQGGVAVFNAVANFNNSRQYKAAYVASCTQHALALNLKWDYDASKMTIPCLMVAGTGTWDNKTIAPLASLRENMAKIPSNVPVVIGRRAGKDHGEMLSEGDGYMTAWFCYWLKGDKTAGKAFEGKKAEMGHNDRWQDVQIHGL
jgi:hypothetical protein